MTSLADKIIAEITNRPGITDKWLAAAIFGLGAPQQRVNGECRHLAQLGKIIRRRRDDGLIGNFGVNGSLIELPEDETTFASAEAAIFSEDEVKRRLEAWLKRQGWSVEVAWGKAPGIDILARRDSERWLIEAKGEGSLNAMRVNYFLAMIGELLQRMDDPEARYSIALPDHKQFRSLWSRLPILVKQRTTIGVLFVRRSGDVEEVS